MLNNQTLQIPELLKATFSASSEAPTAQLAQLASQGLTHVYVDGGSTFQRFLRTGLINDLTITIVRILLGEGKSLFVPLEKDLHLQLGSSEACDCGLFN